MFNLSINMVNMEIEDKTVSVIEISYKDEYISCVTTTPEIADKIMEELSSHIPNLFEGVELMRNDVVPETDIKVAVRRVINKIYNAFNRDK